MKPYVIGVTGGVGAGKSECLKYIEQKYYCRVIYADPEAAKLREKGEACYEALVDLLGTDVLNEDGEIDPKKMAARIYGDEAMRHAVNAILHPAVNARIRGIIEEERAAGKLDFVFVEAALLIENGYESIVDELWYIHADAEVRRKRLKESRGYTDERIDGILAGQLSEAEYRAHCAVVIDNGDDMIKTKKQIDRVLGDYVGGTKRTAE
ncbi:MAG: dephospho-CoA kinase [Lachnospiraceae bacterium]|nr:dephospho-CoA kinase [Lachnospiraceae bacterium]